ncbi:hypothetical protein, partial [Methanocrinis sp.]|uniref:hypothetical protein n=1 Tax=Methanocrinis sp. TaxID=3101522 RepID=UPI003D10F3D5
MASSRGGTSDSSQAERSLKKIASLPEAWASAAASPVSDQETRRKADRIGEPLLIEMVRAGPGGMGCKRFDREDPVPFRIDP